MLSRILIAFFVFSTASCAYIMHCDHYFLDEVNLEGLRSKRYYKTYSNPELTTNCLRPYAAYVRRYSQDVNANRKYPSDTGFLVVNVFYPGSRMAIWDIDLEYSESDFDMNKAVQGYYSGEACDEMEVAIFTTINCGQFFEYDLERVTDSSFVVDYGRGRYAHYELDESIPVNWFTEQEPDWE